MTCVACTAEGGPFGLCASCVARYRALDGWSVTPETAEAVVPMFSISAVGSGQRGAVSRMAENVPADPAAAERRAS